MRHDEDLLGAIGNRHNLIRGTRSKGFLTKEEALDSNESWVEWRP